MNFFEAEKPIQEGDWSDIYKKSRHDLDSPYHIVEIEYYPEDDQGEEEWEFTLLHPDKCSDEAECEFVDFCAEDHDLTDIEEYPPGKYFFEMVWHQYYQGDWDSELVDRGKVEGDD